MHYYYINTYIRYVYKYRFVYTLINSLSTNPMPSLPPGGVVWRIRASDTRLVCAAGSRNGTEETKLLLLDFEPEERGGDE